MKTIMSRANSSATLNLSNNIQRFLEHIVNDVANKNSRIGISNIVKLISEITIEQVNPFTLDHNVSVSCNYRLFQVIKRMVRNFKVSGDYSFRNFEEFTNY